MILGVVIEDDIIIMLVWVSQYYRIAEREGNSQIMSENVVNFIIYHSPKFSFSD